MASNSRRPLGSQAGLVDPDFFDRRVVEVRLQWAEPRHSRDQLGYDTLRVLDGAHSPEKAPVVVLYGGGWGVSKALSPNPRSATAASEGSP